MAEKTKSGAGSHTVKAEAAQELTGGKQVVFELEAMPQPQDCVSYFLPQLDTQLGSY